MQDTYFNSYSGSFGSRFYIGQIVDDSTWKGNEKRSKWANPNDIPGFGSRYKVRVFGRDSANKDTPDDQLEMAEIMYPVTAGSGHAGSFQTANLRQGTYVILCYKDDHDETEPLIIGCLANNDQTQLARNNPEKGFVPRSGYSGEGVAYYSIPPGGSPSQSGSQRPNEGASGSTAEQRSATCNEQLEDGTTVNAIGSKCDPVPATGMQLAIRNLIRNVEKARRETTSWQNAVMRPINYNGQQFSNSQFIQTQVTIASIEVSKFFKGIIDEIRKNTTEKLNDKIKEKYNKVFPNQRPRLKKKVEEACEGLSCAFDRIIANLQRIIFDALSSMLYRVINVADCLIDNFIGGLLGRIIGFIDGILNTVLGPIEALLGATFDLANDILEIAAASLGSAQFTCQEDGTCSETQGWSMFDGAPAPRTVDVDFILNTAQSVASTVGSNLNPATFSMNFLDISASSCFTGPLRCGPPIVQIYGGGGSGALANAVISATGDILGVDIIAPGFGYTRQPFVRFLDNCGRGRGATALVNIAPVGVGTTAGSGVVSIIPETPGSGYLPAPDGSQGGDGRTWAEPNESTVQRNDGTYDPPYPPGSTIEVNPGDTVQLAGEAPYVATEPQTITAPEPVTPIVVDPTVSTSGEYGTQYPVYLTLCEVEITNPGLNYQEGDTIVVEPANGAVLEPVFGSFGVLERINITSVGVGYTERPRIYIQSETGYNAVIVPRLCVNRITDPQDPDVPPPERIIHVVNCVGRV